MKTLLGQNLDRNSLAIFIELMLLVVLPSCIGSLYEETHALLWKEPSSFSSIGHMITALHELHCTSAKKSNTLFANKASARLPNVYPVMPSLACFIAGLTMQME